MALVSLMAMRLLLIDASSLLAAPLEPKEVPAPLKPWIPWVLHGKEREGCPFLYHRGDQHRCAWPATLKITVTPKGATFQQTWLMSLEGYVPLPGDTRQWPQEITLKGTPLLVTEKTGAPHVLLSSGSHTVRGSFTWDHLPEYLRIPSETGLVSLTVNSRPILFPKLDAQGRLWVRTGDNGSSGKEGVKNTLDVQVFRKVVDEVPLHVVTSLTLDIGGDYREVLLGKILFADFIPVSLQSSLPARLEPDGRLRLQVRPGRWMIVFTARHPTSITSIALEPPGTPWATEEIWVFDAQPHLRLVEIGGVPSVDPQQTNLPDDWKALPAYRLHPGDALTFDVKRRGDPLPNADRLVLNRTLWLDFEKNAYTIQDKISGTITQTWRLEMNEPISLGQVRVNGRPQFITRLADSPREGFEVRQGAIDITADSRLEGSLFTLPAVGWNRDIHQMQATLNLPPGWTLFGASGVDHVPGTWLGRWTLLDLFLVLITALAVGHLWGRSWGLLALATLTLTYHELGAPRWMWLHVLAATTLVRVLPTGKFQQAARIYRLASLSILLIIAVPFAVQQIRTGLFPQLEKPWHTPAQLVAKQGRAQAPQRGEAQPEAQKEGKGKERIRGSFESADEHVSGFGLGYESGAISSRVDPTAKIQTGPGLPTWTWNQAFLRWSGPVKKEERVTLLLLSPALNFVLHILQIIFVGFLLARVADWTGSLPPQGPTQGGGWLQRLSTHLRAASLLITSLVSGMVFLLASYAAPYAHADIPSESLLTELRTRLLEKPDCLPACAQIPRLHLTVSSDTLRLRLEVHVQDDVAVPLPGHAAHWLPERALLDGTPAGGLFRDSGGTLWMRLPKGSHHVQLEGALPKRSTVQLFLPLPPRRTSVESDGWNVSGLHENGATDPQIQLTRIKHSKDDPGTAALEPTTLPPFVRIERRILLDLDWRVSTTVTRVSPPGTAILLEVPLIHGESVTTDGVRVKHDKVLVSMGAGQREARWDSVLARTARLPLIASEATEWTETWRLNISPIWHPSFEGIPVIHQSAPTGHYLPEWRPWPGERITVSITRPIGVTGRTLTIDHSRLRVKPGKRATDTTLSTTIRSSQGGQHLITLPQSAQLESVTINGRSQPVRLEDRTLSLPIKPGSQAVEIAWREPTGTSTWLRTSSVDLGASSVNAQIELHVPRDRWPLFTGGPTLGPAVLFWGLLLVIMLVAAGLAQIPLTPLRMWQWGLLGIGLSQIPIWMALVVVGWFLALGGRRQFSVDTMTKRAFNLMQIGLGLWTIVTMAFLVTAIERGLLGTPDMQIVGNGSSTYFLRWYQDQAEPILPHGWVLSVPLWVYRFLMLGWSLWLAVAILKWIRWAWECFSAGGYWRPIKPKVAPAAHAQPQSET